MPIDKTLWYTIDYEAVLRLKDDDVSDWNVDDVNLTRPSSQSDTMCRTKLTRPITKEDPKIYNIDLAAAARKLSVSVDRVAVGSDRADQRLYELTELLIAAHRFAGASFPNGGFSAVGAYLDTLTAEQLLIFCELCHYTDLKADAGDTDIKDFARFIRGMTDQGQRPGLADAERESFAQRLASYIDLVAADVWQESEEI